MQILWTALGQRPCLDRWENEAIWPGTENEPRPGDRQDRFEREVARESPGVPVLAGPHMTLSNAILRYDVFPHKRVTPVLRRAPIGVGDTVGICYHLLPGLALFFAARVTERFDEQLGGLWRTGFTYVTLVRHPELCREPFSFEKHLATGSIVVALRSWSRPGTRLARALAPLVRVIQVR